MPCPFQQKYVLNNASITIIPRLIIKRAEKYCKYFYKYLQYLLLNLQYVIYVCNMLARNVFSTSLFGLGSNV